jgi:UTP--glucose-1-phosphate uridylyltransferase
MIDLAHLDPETQGTLEAFRFDAAQFARLREDVASGRLSAATNIVTGTVEAPLPDELSRLPDEGSGVHDEAWEVGVAALRGGKIAQVVLAGGMATRFGGVVKAVVEVLDGRSFLAVSVGETERLSEVVGAEIPVALMTSFATDSVVRAHAAELKAPMPHVFSQSVSIRLEPTGELFTDDAGQVSLYSPGHGDLFDALRASGTLEALRADGVEHVAIANVDNLGARLDPVVIGSHLVAGRPFTVEVTAKDGDPGGAPARVDGRLRLVEGPCFPPDFDQESIPVCNTNTALVALDAIREPVELSWLYVEKLAGGRPAVQLERLYHELSASVPTTYLEVPRHGPRGRFMPVKMPDDLDRVRPELLESLSLPRL